MQSSCWRVAALIILAAHSKGDLPEDDFRIVRRQDLLASDSDIFVDNRTKSFSQLLFDVARDQVIVGARDVLYRLSLRGLHLLERADWPAPNDKAKACQDKGQTEEDCHNFIKVLLSHGHKVFACGTNAYSPSCTWREIESISNVTEWVTGEAKCPYNPHSNVTSILASSGEYYAGTSIDFTSSDSVICRSQGTAGSDLGTLSTSQYDLNWMNEPQFVGSFEDDTFVYFIFKEFPTDSNCARTKLSRIVRVCKNDADGSGKPSSQTVGAWSTYLKARLTCSVRGNVPFYYDEVLSVEYIPQEGILVATFTTPSNGVAGSAVCVFNMSDIHAAFDGPYRVQGSVGSAWEPYYPSARAKRHFQCEQDNQWKQSYWNGNIDYQRYHVMYRAVEPIAGEPIYKADLSRFSQVTVDIAATKSGSQLVVYVATDNNEVLKLAVLPGYDSACLLEVLRLKDERGAFDVKTIQFVKDTMSLYMGGESGVLRVSGERCARHKRRATCAGVDPHCAWDESRDVCARAREPVAATTLCSNVNSPVDGGWSSWSDWQQCMQDGTAHTTYGDKPDMCSCRTRRCDNPAPAHGGLSCDGPSISVTNCTVHGGWSAWSGWSECSATCGIAVKSRRRACSAPEPRHGGRVCVGLDTQDTYCSSLPPCPDPLLAPVDGGWSAWSAWSVCAGAAGGATCGAGAGWRERRRACTNPSPNYGGAPCDGTKLDRQPCDLRPCELRKMTAWTPWVQIPSNASDGSYMEKRFKFLCKAPSQEQIRLTIAREEDRYCTSRGACSSAPPEEEGGWEAWGPWGECSVPCGGGQQLRTRRCKRPTCAGSKDMLRACNTHACSGQWSCWSEWSECSGSCEQGVTGHRTRKRMCLSPEGCADAGAALESRPCIGACADSEAGWSAWGEWTGCDNGERLRRRSCATDACAGAQIEVARDTDVEDVDNELYAMPAYRSNIEMASFVTMDSKQSLSVGGIVGCVVAAFVLGCLLCLASVIYCQRRGTRLPWSRRQRVPSSPHYITAKQNSYVTVPLKEVPRKAKRQPSFTGIGGSSGILLSKSNNLSNANNHNNAVATPKLFPKAIANEYDSMGTLKRHSNQPSHKNNLDVEEDKFY